MKVTMYTKPVSVNQCWRGRRFKTPIYKAYEKELLLTLPKLVEVPEGDFSIKMYVGFSSRSSDIDNPIKPFLDILQKKYGFDDKRIFQLSIEREQVKKGKEYIGFEFGEVSA